MSMAAMASRPEVLDAIRKRASLFMIIGILLIIFGIVAIIFYYYATVFFNTVLGFLLTIGGAASITLAIVARKSGGAGLRAAVGIIALIIGLLILIFPYYSILTITFLIAIWLTIDGILGIVLGAATKIPGRGLVIAAGVISLLLGILIFVGYPVSYEFVIGVFAGIGMIMMGISFVSVSQMAKRMVRAASAA